MNHVGRRNWVREFRRDRGCRGEGHWGYPPAAWPGSGLRSLYLGPGLANLRALRGLNLQNLNRTEESNSPAAVRLVPDGPAALHLGPGHFVKVDAAARSRLACLDHGHSGHPLPSQRTREPAQLEPRPQSVFARSWISSWFYLLDRGTSLRPRHVWKGGNRTSSPVLRSIKGLATRNSTRDVQALLLCRQTTTWSSFVQPEADFEPKKKKGTKDEASMPREGLGNARRTQGAASYCDPLRSANAGSPTGATRSSSETCGVTVYARRLA